jgi:hypothetical protein
MNRRERVAYHEAGHAVIGRVLGLVCGAATIVPDYSDMSAGKATVHKNYGVTIDAWDSPGHSRSHRENRIESACRAGILMSMAGKEAAVLCCGPGFDGDEDDQIEMAALAYETGDFDRPGRADRLRAAARHLCIRHREKIGRVALALIEHSTLSPDAIDDLMGRVAPRAV